jgi:hypothetical protein
METRLTIHKLTRHPNPGEFLRKSGLLFAINHLVLHPFGLALGVNAGGEGREGQTVGVVGSTKDPEGNVYSQEELEAGAATLREFCKERMEQVLLRLSRLGFIIQPTAAGDTWLGAEVGAGARAFEAIGAENQKLQRLLTEATGLAVAMGIALTASTEVELGKLVEMARKVRLERDTFLAERDAARQELEALGSPDMPLPAPLSRPATTFHRAHRGLAVLLDKVARRLTEVHGDPEASRALLRAAQALEARNLPFLGMLAPPEKSGE